MARGSRISHISSSIASILYAISILMICHNAYPQCNEADSFNFPVLNKDLNENTFWNVPFNHFANYYGELGGYHSGEDWNAVGTTNTADLGKPVRAIANGKVVKLSPLGDLGNLVAIKHTAPKGLTFTIPPREEIVNGQAYQYPKDNVRNICSVYIHLDDKIDLHVNDCVEKGQIIGFIMDPCDGSKLHCPHLHFEIRRDSAINSKNWSLVGETSNWAFKNGVPTGYYLNLQSMVDSGVVHPTDFIEANKKVNKVRRQEMSFHKKGLYYLSKEIDKVTFYYQKRPMTGLKIHHYADGNYYISRKPVELLPANLFLFHLVPNSPISLGGADEIEGSISEIKRNFYIYKVQDNALFLTVRDGKKFGRKINYHSTILSNRLNTASSGLVRWREQEIKIEVVLDPGKYVLFEAEGNVFDKETYPKLEQKCWYINIIDQ